ncbi:MAG: UDP-N-acetylmuramate dehydrogenase [Halarsenatibacteraceae bacterium]
MPAKIKLLKNKLQNSKISFKENEPLSKHTSFEVGGPATIFIEPSDKTDLIKSLEFVKKFNINYFILGGGSNIIVSDHGYNGAIIAMSKLNKVKFQKNTVIAETGISLEELCNIIADNNLTGMEFACGIPGSLGGAVFMNAGAYGGEIKQVIKKASLFSNNNDILEYNKEQLDLDYRQSILQDNNLIAIEAVLELNPAPKSKIKEKMEELNEKRWAKQPMDYPSAGSAFKRPLDNYAGSLIEKAGLKGEKVGGAMVSQKHAGFIINADNARAADIIDLMITVQNKVKKKFNIQLYPEPRFLGQFDKLPELDN